LLIFSVARVLCLSVVSVPVAVRDVPVCACFV